MTKSKKSWNCNKISYIYYKKSLKPSKANRKPIKGYKIMIKLQQKTRLGKKKRVKPISIISISLTWQSQNGRRYFPPCLEFSYIPHTWPSVTTPPPRPVGDHAHREYRPPPPPVHPNMVKARTSHMIEMDQCSIWILIGPWTLALGSLRFSFLLNI